MRHFIITLLVSLIGVLSAAAAELVTPPAGAEAKAYHIMGYSFLTSDNKAYSINIVRTGADIYIQGLYDQLPDAWIKGTVHAGSTAGHEQAVFPSGQYLGTVDPSHVDDSHENFDVYFYCSTDLKTQRDFELDYTPANDTYEALFQYLLFSEADDIALRFDHLQNINIFSGRTELVTPPADMDVRPYTLCGYECSVGKDLEYSVQVGFAADKVYVQGISTAFPDSWIEGTLSDGVVTFMRNQYLGVYDKLSTPFDIWLTGINHDDAYFTDPVFDYDATKGTLTLREGLWLVVNGDPVLWKWLNNMNDVVLYPADDTPAVDYYALVTPPAEADVQTFTLTANDYSFGSPDAVMPYDVDVAFASDGIYLRGLFSEIPEAWVYGTFDGTLLTLHSPQYLGQWFGVMDCWLMGSADDEQADIVFTYDATRQAFVLADGLQLYFNDTYTEPSPMAFQMLGDVVLTGNLPVGIASTLTAPVSAHAIFNLQGQRTSCCAPHGVSIIGGRKVVR